MKYKVPNTKTIKIKVSTALTSSDIITSSLLLNTHWVSLSLLITTTKVPVKFHLQLYCHE